MMATGNFYASLLAVRFAVLSTSPTRLSAQQIRSASATMTSAAW